MSGWMHQKSDSKEVRRLEYVKKYLANYNEMYDVSDIGQGELLEFVEVIMSIREQLNILESEALERIEL